MSYIDRSIYFFTFCSLLGLTNLHSEAGIYLPFPDLPKEILEPETQTSDERKIAPTETKEKVAKPTPLPKGEQPSEREKKRRTSPKPPSLSLQEDTPSMTLNPQSMTPNPNRKETSNGEKPKEAPTPKESPLPPEDEWGSFREAMAQTRALEQSDPKKAADEYRNLLQRFSHSFFRSKILISLAWNHYHREEYFNSLDACIQILEDRDLIESEEYPTAMYLAYLIHGKPWNGRNVGFQRKFSEIFHRNANAGRKNFQTSLYLSKIPNPG